MTSIAIVEDDADQRRHYREAIEARGFDVSGYADRGEAATALAQHPPDLAILDIILGPERDGGFRLCSELLARYPDLPILFLTERIDEIDRISGLRLGAWDYQPKPIGLDFLAEKVISLLRLTEIRARPQQAQRIRRVGRLGLDEAAMQADWDGRPLDLTLTEFRLLARLVRTVNQPVSYQSLMNATVQQRVTHNTINTHMRNLRRKLRELEPAFDAIGNEYGFGYRWREP